MEFVIKPYESVGPIKLGMTKEEIREHAENFLATQYQLSEALDKFMKHDPSTWTPAERRDVAAAHEHLERMNVTLNAARDFQDE